MKTYAILTDKGPERATASEVTTDPAMAAESAAAHLALYGDGWDLAFVQSGTRDHERVWLSQCLMVHDVPAFVARMGDFVPAGEVER